LEWADVGIAGRKHLQGHWVPVHLGRAVGDAQRVNEELAGQPVRGGRKLLLHLLNLSRLVLVQVPARCRRNELAALPLCSRSAAAEAGRIEGRERSEQEEEGAAAIRRMGERERERSEQEEEGAAAIRLWARSKKRALLLSVFGLARRRRRCCYPSLGSLEEEGAAAVAARLWQMRAESRVVGGRPPEPPLLPARSHMCSACAQPHTCSAAHVLGRTGC
jgi:hypothetical protein